MNLGFLIGAKAELDYEKNTIYNSNSGPWIFGFMNACSDEFLEVTPNGALSEEVLATADGVDALLIGAYSMLDGISNQGTGGWEATTSGWVYGSIRGLEANKGLTQVTSLILTLFSDLLRLPLTHI